MKRRNFVQSVISRQYDDPAINIQHISEDDEPSEATGGLIPAIEGPSTSTATGAGGLSSRPSGARAGLIPAIEGPSTSIATGVGGLSSRSDFRTYNKKGKNQFVLAPHRFNKPLVSNEKTMRRLSNTPKVEEEKQDDAEEEDDAGEEVEEVVEEE